MRKPIYTLVICMLVLVTLVTAGCVGTPATQTPSSVPTTASPTPTQTGSQTAVPSSTPSPSDEATLPTPSPYAYPVYKVSVNQTDYRLLPDSDILGQLMFGTLVEMIQVYEGIALVRLDDGKVVCCDNKAIVPETEVFYAYPERVEGPKINLKTGKEELGADGKPIMVYSELIDLRLYVPDAKYEQLFATSQNILGKPLYPVAIPLLQKNTAEKVKQAFDIFKKDGYTLVINDAYRPLSVQKQLYDVVKVPYWIADPYTTGSNHNRGAAVDIALLDANGNLLDFPTPMHTFVDEAARGHASWTEEQKKNVDYMTRVMESCGFTKITSEWWHFNDKDSKQYMITDLDLSKLPMSPKKN